MSEGELDWFLMIFGIATAIFGSVSANIFTAGTADFHDNDTQAVNIRRQRQGEVIGSVVTLAVGIALSAKTGSRTPLYYAMAIAGAYVGGSEYMMAHPAQKEITS